MLATILGGLLFSPIANAEPSSSLTVQIQDLKNQEGVVCLTLFNSEKGFPSQGDRAIANRCISAQQATVKTTFDQLEPGQYAIAVLHDANKDGKMNTGFLGIPKEGFGFSRNPEITTRAPKFQESAIDVAGKNTTIEINLQYFL